MPYSRGLLVICYVVVDYGNPKTVCRPSHANMTEAVRGGAANAHGDLRHLVSQLKRFSNIESVPPVTGRFDLVIRLKTNHPIKPINSGGKISRITSITSTQTAFSVENVTNAKNRGKSSEPP